MVPPLIQVDHLTYSYPAYHGEELTALRGVSLKIEEGEFIALVGANGSGKTTLARHLNGLLLPTSGIVRVAGLDTRQPANRKAIQSMVGMVFQFPEDQIVATVVEEDVAFGPENLGLPPAEIRRRVEQSLQEVGLWEQRLRPPYLLSAGQMQRLALAGVLAMHPACVVFDEVTTMLDPQGRRKAFELMARLHCEGVTVLYITHFMDEAAQAERVIVLHQGRVALDGPPTQVFRQSATLQELGLDLPPASQIANRLRTVLPDLPEPILTLDTLIQALPVKENDHSFKCPRDDQLDSKRLIPHDRSPLMVEVEELGHVYLAGTPLAQRALEGVSLQVSAGEAHGLAGATGSGKSTLLQHLNGLLRPQEGRVRIGRYDLSDPKIKTKDIVRLAGLVFQNPEIAFFEQYVGDEIAYGPRCLDLRTDLAARVRRAMEQVNLDFERLKDRPIFALSGGERRKVALAAILAIQPQLLLLDEPLAGLDPASSREVLQHLEALRTEGITLVLSSHQMEHLARLTGQVHVFQAGQRLFSGLPSQVFGRADVLRQAGLEPPMVTQVAEALRCRGWVLPSGITDLEVLLREVGR